MPNFEFDTDPRGNTSTVSEIAQRLAEDPVFENILTSPDSTASAGFVAATLGSLTPTPEGGTVINAAYLATTPDEFSSTQQFFAFMTEKLA